MKRLSLQWRITLMTVLLIGVNCVSLELLIGASGIYYMDVIGESIQDYAIDGEPAFFNPETTESGQALTLRDRKSVV